MNNNKKIKTRFCPSPTGFATVANLRTALFNYLYAKKHNGEFLLRIEDTDKKRSVLGSEEYIIESLKWLGIVPNDGVNPDGSAKYRQSEKDYSKHVEFLLKNNYAYYAFDSEGELEEVRKQGRFSYNSETRLSMKNSFSLTSEEVEKRIERGDTYVVRFNTPSNREIKLFDLVCGETVFNTSNVDDKVLWKSDGTPSYFLANTIDDIDFEITHVIKGNEWLSSFPTIFLLYEAFGIEMPSFAHLPLVLGPDGKKMSKRKMKEYGFPVFPLSCSYIDDKGIKVDVVGFKELGYEPDALVNFIALLGWNPGGTKEIMTVDEMVDLFDLNRINNSGAMFDVDKLKNFNAHYLRSRPWSDLYSSYIVPKLKNEYGSIPYVGKFESIVDIAKVRSVFSKDLYGHVSYFFEPVILKDGVGLKNPDEFRGVMKSFTVFFSHHEDNWTAAELEKFLTEECESRGFKIGKILPDLRLALTGGAPGPDLPMTMYILGRKETLTRIQLLLIKTEKVAV